MRANEFLPEDWNKVNRRDKTNGLSQKAVNAYRRENPGSKLKTAVTTKPSKLKKGSKAAKRRKSFCARMGGNKGPMKKPNGKPTPKALALRRWNCESIEEMRELIQLGEQYVSSLKENFISEDAMMGKLADDGKIIRILKKAHTVPFSDEKNWLLVDVDPAKGNKGLGLKWIPADTRFEWVRPYRDTVDENFADGKNPQDKGDSKRHGVPTKSSVSNLRKVAKQGGRKGQLAHWMANMKAGRAKKK
jgi:hypothetical protein